MTLDAIPDAVLDAGTLQILSNGYARSPWALGQQLQPAGGKPAQAGSGVGPPHLAGFLLDRSAHSNHTWQAVSPGAYASTTFSA